MRDATRTTELPLIDAGRKPGFSIGVVIAMLCLGSIGVGIGAYRHPPNDASVIPLTVLTMVVVIITTFMLMRVVSRATATLDHGDLMLQTGVGKKRIALSNLRKNGLQVIDLTRHPELAPRLRVWGASMPGLATGWFRLRNGEKAVCLLTDRARVCYLRSDADNLSVMLSLRDPAPLKAALDR
jgi:Bacterial PH domain